jgi:signal transduction histidine kinase
MVRPKINSITRLGLFSTHEIPTLIVFLMMMVLVGFSWRTATRAVNETRDEEVSERANYAETNIRQRILLNENTLRAAAGLFGSSGEVTRQQWSEFVSSLELGERMPGIIGIGYSEFLLPSDIPSFEQRMQSDGFPDFTVKPKEPARDLYSSIKYIEPLNERNRQALGGDLYSESARHQAMDKARDNATTTMSEITLVLQDESVRKNGVNIFHPVYETGKQVGTLEGRREAILGFVYAPLSAERLFGQIFPDKNPDFNFQIYDADTINNESLLYEQFPDSDENSYKWVQEDELTVTDQTWVIRYGIRDTIVPAAIRNRPQGIIAGGLIFALFVAAVVYLLLQKRGRIITSNQDIKIERAKDNLLSLASHQLRTPATGVKQYVGMVLEGFVGDLPAEQRELLNKAYDSNERQLRIINEFLYLAKADAGRIVISPQSFDLVAFTRNIIKDMRSEINDAGHKVRLKSQTKTLITYADTHSARMIIENLISNAIKYTPLGGKISITLRRKNNYVLFVVADNGVGIEQKDFPKLFKQFSRIPNELTKQTSGSGIGLYLARYLVKLNGGTITVESERGVGSTFTVSFRGKVVRKITDVTRKRK